MVKNYIIGLLIGYIVSGAEFWEYSNSAQHVMVTIVAGLAATSIIWELEGLLEILKERKPK